MSRIGKLPVAIPSGVTASLVGSNLLVKGPKGDLSVPCHSKVNVTVEEKEVVVTRNSDLPEERGLHGLTRTLIQNAVDGVTKGFEKRLEIVGVGYKAQVQGKDLNLSLGFSHPVVIKPMDGIVLSIDPGNKNIIVISGIDKQAVGQIAADIRKLRKPEPYKGKGIRYEGEYVRRKAGKSAK
ncbi:MAG: 50S ribosomal protein L6 [Patescibacteria group bacterium]|nr:50S ribosomal protein L6 [Patescibacteria group bacterium]